MTNMMIFLAHFQISLKLFVTPDFYQYAFI